MLLNKQKFTAGELSLLPNWHVGGGWGETFSKFIGVVAFHGHADPGELHPDPSFIVIIGGRFLIQLEFFNNCLCV